MFIDKVPDEAKDWPIEKQVYLCRTHGLFIVENCTINHPTYGANTLSTTWKCPTCQEECTKIRREPRIKKYPTFDKARDRNLHPSLEGIPLGEVPGDEDYYNLNSITAPKP